MLAGSEEKSEIILKQNERLVFFNLQLRNCLMKLRKDTRQQYFIFLLNLRNVYKN